MPTTIHIPSFDQDSRIGNIFATLFSVVAQTESSPTSEVVVWHFDGCELPHPFFISALCIYRHNTDRKIIMESVNSDTAQYLSDIRFDSILYLKDKESALTLRSEYSDKSFIPFCKFASVDGDIIDSVTSILQSIIQQQSNLPANTRSPLSYLVAELTTNIHDHSESDYGFMFSHYLSKDGCLYLCIADRGVSVYGSFIESDKFRPDQLEDEGDVLNMALSHYSTKNLRDQENRGFGLPTSKHMLVDGMGGSFYILSGNAFHSHDSSGEQTVVLPSSCEWEGTLILMQIPVNLPDSFNYLNYIERI